MSDVRYSMSCNSWGDGKSVCIWRRVGNVQKKIARFQSDEAAKLFAKDFGFPLNDELKARLDIKDDVICASRLVIEEY